MRHAASTRCAKHTTPVDVLVPVDVPAAVVTAAPTPRLRIMTFSYPTGVLQ